MTERKDIRWQQRFSNFTKALAQLDKFILVGDLNELEEQGLIKSFEYTYELAWKTLQDLLREKGYEGIAGPKPVIEQAFQDGYIINGRSWVNMHQSRNLTSHTYNQETAEEIIVAIIKEYHGLLKDLHARLELEQNNPSKLFD